MYCTKSEKRHKNVETTQVYEPKIVLEQMLHSTTAENISSHICCICLKHTARSQLQENLLLQVGFK